MNGTRKTKVNKGPPKKQQFLNKLIEASIIPMNVEELSSVLAQKVVEKFMKFNRETSGNFCKASIWPKHANYR